MLSLFAGPRPQVYGLLLSTNSARFVWSAVALHIRPVPFSPNLLQRNCPSNHSPGVLFAVCCLGILQPRVVHWNQPRIQLPIAPLSHMANSPRLSTNCARRPKEGRSSHLRVCEHGLENKTMRSPSDSIFLVLAIHLIHSTK